MRTERPIRYQEISPRRRRSRTSPEQAAKRYSVRRAKPVAPLLTRARLRILLAAAVGAVVLLAFAFVYRSPLFAVRGVHLSGLGPLLPQEAAQARAVAEIPPGTNLLRLSRGRLEAALKRVPAIADARVTRTFPNRVDISVTSRAPIAVLATGGEQWEMDRAAVAIRPLRPDVKLPVIDCLASQPISAGQRVDAPGVAGALRAAALTSRGKPLGIAKIEVDQNADICLNMVDSIAIRIGQTDELDTKLQLVRSIYDERPGIAADVESIDLRFPEAPAYLPRGTAKKPREGRLPGETAATGARDRESASADQMDASTVPPVETSVRRPVDVGNGRRRRSSRRNSEDRSLDAREGDLDHAPGERR